MKTYIRPALVLFALLTILTGVVYPLFITLAAQTVFPTAANGSLIKKGDTVQGSELIGQPFDDAKYFWGRPSGTSPTLYNGASSTGSNLSPTNSAFTDSLKERVAALRKAHPEQTGPVPVDLVTASASGLDPHISPAAAEYQLKRVATARGLTVESVRVLVEQHTQGRTFGVLGEPRVNVLRLNLALDEQAK